MELADGVRAVGQAQAEGGHVELARVAVDAAPELEDPLDRDAAGVGRPSPSSSGPATRRTRSASNRSLPAETGRVDREDAVAARPPASASSRGAPAGDELAGALREQERGVALVEVPDGRRDAERPERPHAADAQDELLVQPHLAAADVQDVGDRPVGAAFSAMSVSSRRTGTRPTWATQTATVQVAARELDGHRQRAALRVLDAAERQPAQVVVGVVVLLVAVGVDRLAEVALAVEEPDADERQGHVAGRLHVVAGEDAEAARVDAERFVEAVLGAEVGDRAVERVGVAALEPVVGAVGHVAGRTRPRTSWYSARKFGSSSRRDQSVGPLRTGIGLR